MFDDVVTATAGTLDEHLADVGKVFDRLIQAGFTVKCEKVHLAIQEGIPYLGFSVGASGTKPLPEKTAALLEMSCSDLGTDPAGAARFAGMMGYYHRFIPNLHSTLQPFHELKAKGAQARDIMTTLRFKAAFTLLKYQLANVTALSRPDYSKPFYIDVDAASSVGAGAILSQYEDSEDLDTLRPIAWWSRRFNPEERRYGVRDQECMALVEALETWRQYIVGTRTIVRTDHKSLEWLLTTHHKDGTRVSGFALRAQGYDIEITYVPGDQHLGADCMSRAAGEKERGRLPPYRPSIEDRVYEAAGLVADTIVRQPSCRALDEKVPKRFGRQCVAILVRSGTRDVLVEEQDGQLSLPTLREASRYGVASYRQQLRLAVQCAYPDGKVAEALDAPRATRVRVRGERVKQECIAFVGPVDPLAPAPVNVNNMITTKFIDALVLPQLFIAQGLAQEAGVIQLALSRIEQLHQFAFTLSGEVVEAEEELPLSYVPTVDTHPDGPALISTTVDAAYAGRRLRERLAAHPGLSIAVDLEGHRLGAPVGRHTSLIQLAVDAVEPDEQGLVYVLDTHVAADSGQELLRQRDNHIRHILEDPAVPKVFHCGHGDLAALYYEFRITVQHVFDTGIADGVLIEQHANKSRNLGKVLRDWVGSSVKLHVKGQLVHIDHMWEQRPLILRHFVYAYEDVTYCNRLYRRQRAALKDSGMLELVEALSQQRSPPVALPAHHRFFQPPTHAAIALIDHSGHVFCIQRKSDGSCLLPEAAFVRASSTAQAHQYKEEARLIWAKLMGPPPKLVRAVINARLRKAVRVRDTLLYVGVVPESHDCLAIAESIFYAASRAVDHETSQVVVRQYHTPQGPMVGAEERQVCLFQQLFLESSRKALNKAAVVHVAQVGSEPGQLGVNAHLTTRQNGRVQVRLAISHYGSGSGDRCQDAQPPASEETMALVTGATGDIQPIRAAAILHDERHVYVVIGKDGLPSFPTHGLEADTSQEETAAMAFDTYAGVSLRKIPSVNALGGRLAMKHANAFVHAAESAALPLGQHGNMVYYSWHVAYWDGLRMSDHRAAFHASRRMVNGFQMVASKKDLHPGFAILPIQDVARQLTEYLATTNKKGNATAAVRCDLEALRQAEARQARTTISTVISRLEAQLDDPVPTAVGRQAQHSEQEVATDQVLSLVSPLAFATLEAQLDSHASTTMLHQAQHSEQGLTPGQALALAGRLAQHSEAAEVCVNWDAVEVTGTSSDATGPGTDTAVTSCLATEPSVTSPQPSATGDSPLASVSVTTPQLATSSQASSQPFDGRMPRVGEDSEYDSLFISAVAMIALTSAQQSACLNSSAPPPVLTREQIREMQHAHPGTAQYIEYIRHGSAECVTEEDAGIEGAFQTNVQHMRLEGGVLLWFDTPDSKGRLVLPPAAQAVVLQLYHDFNNHLGVVKVLDVVMRRFHWGSRDFMRKTISEHIRLCGPCTRVKIPRHSAGAAQLLDMGFQPNDILSGDVYDVGLIYDGFSHTLDFACHFTRRVTSIAVKGMPSASQIADALIEVVIRHHGVPREIRSDRGSNFIHKALEFLYKKMRISIVAGTAYNHHLVALIERWHHTLKTLLRIQKVQNADDNWPSRLALLEFSYNTTVHAVTGYSPFFVDHARHAHLPWDAMIHSERRVTEEAHKTIGELPEWVATTLKNHRVVYDATTQALQKQGLHAKRKWDLRHDVALHFKPGDQALLIEGAILDGKPFPKTDTPTTGPYTVARCLPNDRYQLTDMGNRRIHSVVHVSRMIPFYAQTDPLVPWMHKDHESGGRWPVHSVQARRTNNDGGVSYKIRWSGFDTVYDRWIERHHLDPIGDLCADFDEQHGHATQLEFERPTHSSVPPPEAQAVHTQRFRFGAHGTSSSPTHVTAAPLPRARVDEPLSHTGEDGGGATPADDAGAAFAEDAIHTTEEAQGPESRPQTDERALRLLRRAQRRGAIGETHDADRTGQDAALGSESVGASQQVDRPANPFPVGTRVDVHYPKESAWYTGRVVSTRVTRPRLPGVLPERRIVVRYEDPLYKGDLLEHSLTDSTVRRHHAPVDEVATDESLQATDSLDERTRRRLLRTQRRLQ